jgi:hypothetical protein
MQAPMSPGSEARDKERFNLLLEINQELLYESVQLQYTQQEMKKEAADQPGEGVSEADKRHAECEQDYKQ